MNVSSFLLAFWLGVAFSAPPGIVTVESISKGLRGGYWSAFAVGLGSLIGDGTYAILAFSGLSFIVQDNTIKFTVGLVGICFMVYLAISAFKVKNLSKIEGDAVSNNKNRTAFINGAVLSLTNPWAIAFWLSFGGILISSGISTNSENLWLFLVTFLAGATFWVFILSGLIAFGKRFVNDKVFHAISFISGLIFLGTAGHAILQVLIV